MASSMSFIEWTSFNPEEPARTSRTPSTPSPSKPRSRRVSSTFFDDCPMDEKADDVQEQRTHRQQVRRQEQQQIQRQQQQLTLQKQREQQEQEALQKLRQKQKQALEHQRRKQQAIELQRQKQQQALALQRQKQQQLLQQQRQQQQVFQQQRALEQQRQKQKQEQQAIQQQQRNLQKQQQILLEQRRLQQQRQQQQQQQQQALQRQHQLLQEQKRQEQQRQQQMLQEQKRQQQRLQEQKRQQQQQRYQKKKSNVTVVMEKQMDDIELVLSDAQSQLSKSRSLQSQSSSLSASLRSKNNTRYVSMAGDEDDSEHVTRAVSGRLRELRRQSVLGRSSPSTSVAPSPPPVNSQPSSRFAPQFHPVPPPPPATPPPPPAKPLRGDSPSGFTWNDSDDSSDSSQDSSKESQDNKRIAKRSRILKGVLIAICVVLVVFIGYLLGQWYQQSKLSKNSQQVQQQGNGPTASPMVGNPIDAANAGASAQIQIEPTEPVIGYDYTANSDFLVGVYYYPWHNQNFHNGDGYMRKELVPKHTPALGEYNDSDPGVISHHMKWFRQANIGLLVTSWWGPNRHEDIVTKDVIMEHEEVGNLKIALHYETTGRIGKQGEKLLTNAKPDIQYMCENYFDHPNYYKIDGRPVLFIYVSRLLETIGVLDEALLTMRSTASKCGHNLYLIGDAVFDSAPDPNEPHVPFWYFDAVTNYDVYGAQGRPEGHAGTDAVDKYYDNQAEWKAQALEEDCRYIPAVSPGYNDRGVRMERDHPPLSRRITSSSKEGSLFNYQLKQAKELVDSEVDKMILVNSFNEWHEDTQIEPVVGEPAIEPFNFTKGLEYVGYGELYLDILGAATSKDATQHEIYDYLF